MTDVLKEICLANRCVWAKVSPGGEDIAGGALPLEGTLFCAAGQDPQRVLSDSGCTAATVEGQFAALQGGDLFFGTMTEQGIEQNKDPRVPPADHPMFQE